MIYRNQPTAHRAIRLDGIQGDNLELSRVLIHLDDRDNLPTSVLQSFVEPSRDVQIVVLPQLETRRAVIGAPRKIAHLTLILPTTRVVMRHKNSTRVFGPSASV